MPNVAPESARPALPRIPISLLVREVARIAVAFVVYLILQPGWTWSGLERLYDSLVMALAEWIFIPTQHFPIARALDSAGLRNLDFAVVFTLGLLLVSTGIPWRSRLKRFALVLLVVYAVHVLTVILHVKVTSTVSFNRQGGLLILLPWEFKIVERLKYLVYDFGLQAGPFVLAMLTMAWNAGLSLPARVPKPGRWKHRLAIGAVSLIVVVAAVVSWSVWRESHPLHVQAHATLGLLFHGQQKLEKAEEQYRIAIRGGTQDPSVFYNLAGIDAWSGRQQEALDVLVQGRRLTSDPEWSAKFEQAIADLGPLD